MPARKKAARKKPTRKKQAPTKQAASPAAGPADARATRRAESKSHALRFDPSKLDRTVIALPLVQRFEAGKADTLHRVVIDINLDYHQGREAARERVIELIAGMVAKGGASKARSDHAQRLREQSPEQYVAEALTAAQIRTLVQLDMEESKGEWRRRTIYRIWPDFEVHACLLKSVATVKADAARIAFKATGKDIVWAVMDSGIDATHPHFGARQNLQLQAPVQHMSFTGKRNDDPLEDAFGHGTHVAGIIGGELGEGDAPNATPAGKRRPSPRARSLIYSVHSVREDDSDEPYMRLRKLTHISGVAPFCKLVSMKVLNESGNGSVSSIMRALQKVQEINQHGRRLLIHGVNLSLGYDFDPEWFACGHSPLCVEVDRLVRSGVVVVVAAGNSGYGYLQTEYTGTKAAGLPMTINDPGNSDTAITVGSTHREMPHAYGASYFSSKGPTGDGRIKPDLLAPGEKIISCAAGAKKTQMLGLRRRHEAERSAKPAQMLYVEDSGTSMAAPHVSGAIAAFLSVRREFLGQPELVKELFLKNATDLRRDRYLQGCGLLDLMRTIQSV